MICCGHCGARNFKAEGETIDCALVAALLVKYGGSEGVALVGSGTLAWAQRHVAIRVEQDGDAMRLRWSAPPLNGDPAASPVSKEKETDTP